MIFKQDCAQEFVLHTLQHDLLLYSRHSPAYLNRCAANFTRNFRRNHARITHYETTWPQQTDENGVCSDQEFAAPTTPCASGVMRKEMADILRSALNRLTATQRHLLIRHFFSEETFVDLAKATGSTPDAIRMTVNRALNRLKALLAQQGINAEDADEYLAEIARVRGG